MRMLQARKTTWFGLATMGFAALWAASASSWSARGFITVATELSSYFPSVLVCVAGMFLYLLGERGFTMSGLSRLGVCLGFLFIIILFWWSLGVQAFSYWKFKTISPAEWAAMSAELENLLTARPSDAATMGLNISRDDVPESFLKLGLPREYYGGFTYKADERAHAYVSYGNKVRCWGLFVGSEALVRAKFRRCRINQVSTNTFCFIGSYD